MITAMDIGQWRAPAEGQARVSEVVASFLDLATTATGRATHYNSLADQHAAEAATHAALFELDRRLYAALLVLPGQTDRARQQGIRRLLSQPRPSDAVLSAAAEAAIIEALVDSLPATRQLRLFVSFGRDDAALGLTKLNNARARKLVLRTILASPKLELWAVKYRAKLRAALVHAWGQRTASFLRAALSTPVGERSQAQQRAITRHIAKHAGGQARIARECVGFVLGARLEPTLALLVAFEQAKHDLDAGKRLPPEVLEGLRSTYHREVAPASILALTKHSMTKTQRRQVQRRAAAAEVEVRFDPLDYEPVELYIHAFANGLDAAIVRALVAKASRAAASFPVRYQRLGLVVDASASMAGSKTQPLRPMAIALALRDLLTAASEHSRVRYCGGEFRAEDHAGIAARGAEVPTLLCRPRGHTALAEALLDLLDVDEAELPEAIYLISDGYENAEAGRVDEVVRALADIGIHVPIFHLSPVFAAEQGSTGGVRSLAEGLPSLPVQRPDALGLSFLRLLVLADPERAINALLRTAIGQLAPEQEVQP